MLFSWRYFQLCILQMRMGWNRNQSVIDSHIVCCMQIPFQSGVIFWNELVHLTSLWKECANGGMWGFEIDVQNNMKFINLSFLFIQIHSCLHQTGSNTFWPLKLDRSRICELLNPFTLRVPQESIVCYFHTFENNLEIKQILTKYLKESCW